MKRKLAAAAVGAIALILPATAAAAPTPTPSATPTPSVSASPATATATPGVIANFEYDAASYAYSNSWWVHSTVYQNWYVTNNGNMSAFDVVGSTTWQQFKDVSNLHNCLTFDGGTDGIMSETCVAGKASQNWASARDTCNGGFSDCWHMWNQYISQKYRYCGSFQEFITAPSAVDALQMECPSANGGTAVGDNQRWILS